MPRNRTPLLEHDGKWRHGRVTVALTHLSFQPCLWQVRMPSGDPLELDVSELGEDTARRPPLHSIWRLNPQLRIVQLLTNRGRLELAALPSQIAELRKLLDDPEAIVP